MITPETKARIERLWSELETLVGELDRLRTVHCFATAGKKASVRLSGALGISRQRRHYWMRSNLDAWLSQLEKRLQLNGSIPSPRRRSRISNADWDWIAKTLAGRRGLRWVTIERLIRGQAAASPQYAHLSKISATTLWRHRGEIAVRLREHPYGVPFRTSTRR
jgi:hypothetical protein